MSSRYPSLCQPTVPDAPSGRLSIGTISPPSQHGHLQLACLASTQLLSTPLYLLGMDLYYTPNSTIMARGKCIASEYNSAVVLRVSRICPAFGIGGKGNKVFRNYFASLFISCAFACGRAWYDASEEVELEGCDGVSARCCGCPRKPVWMTLEVNVWVRS